MGRIRAIAAVAVLSATTSGCWLQAGFGSAKTGFNSGESTVTAANVAELEVAWTADLGTDAREALIRAGTAYVRSNGAVTAIDLGTGDEQWSVSSVGAAQLSGTGVPAVVEGTLRVPVSGPLCAVVGLDLGTGEFIEGQTFGAPIFPPTWNGGCSTSDVLEVDGAAVVPYNWAASGLAPNHGQCPDPMQYGIFQGVGVVDVSGNTEWTGVHESQSGCGGLPTLPPPYGPQSVVGNEVLVSKGGNLRAFPLTGCPTDTTCPTWSLDGGSIVAPPVALGNGDIAVAHPDGWVDVIDGTTHATKWQVEPIAGLAAPIAATDTGFYVALSSGQVGAFSNDGCGAELCFPHWAVMVPSGASARPSIGGDVLYIGATDGTVTAVPANCPTTPCPPLWTFDTGSRISGAPTIYGGTLIVGSEDGTVTAFRLPD